MKKKEQNYKLKYAIIQKTLDDLRQLYITSLKDNHIDKKEYQRFVTQFENYRVASHEASQVASQTKSRTASHTKSQVASRATANAASHTAPTIPLEPHNFLYLIYSILTEIIKQKLTLIIEKYTIEKYAAIKFVNLL